VLRADVYARVPVAPAPRALDRLRGHAGPLLLPLSSGEALQRMLEALPADLAARLRGACVLAASARLAALAQSLGCTDIRQAGGPGPRALLAAWPGRP
jgi:uroporphyrinogen-III synthase